MAANFFLSNSDSGGGIAFNVYKLAEGFKKNGKEVDVLILNKNFLHSLMLVLKEEGVVYLYSTSAKTLIFACLSFLIRFLFRKKSIISQIIYHPRFCDPNVSLFRKLMRFALTLLPRNNLYYYCDEAVLASNIAKASEVHSNNVIGLCSMIESVIDVEPPKELIEKMDNYKFHICTIGRLVDFKLGSILALIEYAKQNQSKLLTITGYGPLEKEIVEYIRGQENILFLGQRTIEETKSILNCCDIYVGMGTTLVDAASLGKRAIVAIESSTEGLTTGFFGEVTGTHYGEFMSSHSYYNLKDYLNNLTIDSMVASPNKLKSPWLKLISSHAQLKKSSIPSIFLILLVLLLSFCLRPFVRNDYH